MDKFKIGGRIILEDEVSYRILDILNYNGQNYLFCCTEIKPIEPKILHCKEKNGDVYVCVETDKSVILEVMKLIIKNQ